MICIQDTSQELIACGRMIRYWADCHIMQIMYTYQHNSGSWCFISDAVATIWLFEHELLSTLCIIIQKATSFEQLINLQDSGTDYVYSEERKGEWNKVFAQRGCMVK